MKRILITGSTGFIGGRLAEVLVARGTSTVALVREWQRAARLSRLPLEMVHGDILDDASLRRAMEGCDVVFHCAVDFRRIGRAHRRSSVVGTQKVMQAALEAGARRVVYLSSIAVYGGRPPDRVLTEDLPVRHTRHNYGDAKIDAERVALGFFRKHGLPVTVLRPTIVYGPFGGVWTENTVAAIRVGRMVLVNGGTGVCNSLYVDNLVEAMILAAEHPAAAGEVFNISDAPPITWREFIEGHARALGDGYLPLPEMTVDEIERVRASARSRRPSSIAQILHLLSDPQIRTALRSIPFVARLEGVGRAVVRNVVPSRGQTMLRAAWSSRRRSISGPQVGAETRPLLPRGLVALYASRAVFSIEKARRVLGYDPKIDFEEGMARTAAWVRWAGI